MTRLQITTLVIALLFSGLGCDKAQDLDSRAELMDANSLMPAGTPGAETVYLANQKENKVNPVRDISYEPLDNFRDKNAADYEKKHPKVTKKTPRSKRKAGPGKKPGPIGRFKRGLAGLFGKPKGAAAPPPMPEKAEDETTLETPDDLDADDADDQSEDDEHDDNDDDEDEDEDDTDGDEDDDGDDDEEDEDEDDDE